MKNADTFLVTGATGALGSILVERLLAEGCKVIGIGRKEKGFLSEKVLNNNNFIFLRENLTKSFIEALKDFKIKGIFHLASQLPYSDSLTYRDFYSGNVETTIKVIDLAKNKKPKFVVYVSTCSIFGKQPKEKILNENALPSPVDYYGLTKNIAEVLLEMKLRHTDIKVIIMRYPHIFGKNILRGIVNSFYHLAKKRKAITIFGNGGRFRNLIYINDAVDILLSVNQNITKLNDFEIFVVGSKKSLRLIEIARIIRNLIQQKARIVRVNKKPPADWDVFIDASKAQKLLNFKPRGIKDSLELYCKEMQK